MRFIAIVTLFLLFFSSKALPLNAQQTSALDKRSQPVFGLLAGSSYSHIRYEIDLRNIMPSTGYYVGLSLTTYPFKKLNRLTLLGELGVVRKGYKQELGQRYDFNFNYLTLPILLEYDLIKSISLQGGVAGNKLISTSVEQGTLTYNNYDLDLIGGVNFFKNRKINVFTRVVYGVYSVLDYYEIDPLGNFTSEIRDIKHFNIIAGLKLNFNDNQ
ncbi:outer membrane beta-barrel protein [Algivirga pacifica]|uniref:Outer membrane protein beta-barrel domain-containing protein n=1 Tax=Algivirga pacifica TaxID=1162670 RepID=A0ABP9D436_9BACT